MDFLKGKRTKIFGILAVFAALAGALFGFANVYASSNPSAVAGSANVLATCFISILPTSITFANSGQSSIAPGGNSNTANSITDNDINGNVAATILVAAGIAQSGLPPFTAANSIYQSGANSFGVTNTLYSASSQGSYTGTAVTNALVSTSIPIAAPTQASPTAGAQIYFGLGVPGGTPSGLYTTNIIIENNC